MKCMTDTNLQLVRFDFEPGELPVPPGFTLAESPPRGPYFRVPWCPRLALKGLTAYRGPSYGRLIECLAIDPTASRAFYWTVYPED